MRFDYFTILKWGTPPSFVQVLKFDTAQPRNPAGSGRISGRWTKGAFVAGATPWSPKTSPPVKGGGAESQGGVQIPASPLTLGSGSIKHTTYPAPARAAGESSAPVVRSSGSMAVMAPSSQQQGAKSILNQMAGQSPGHPASWSPKTSPPPATQPTTVAATNPEAHVQTAAKPATSVEAPNQTVQNMQTSKILSGSKLGYGHANAAYKVTLDDPNRTPAVFKPEAGENWTASFNNHDINNYVTNRQFSLGEREAFAYEVDRQLKLGVVPETVHRDKLNVAVVGLPEPVVDSKAAAIPDVVQQGVLYEAYRAKAEAEAGPSVERGMQAAFRDAQDYHAREATARAAEVAGIWNELVKNYPDAVPVGPPPLSHHAILKPQGPPKAPKAPPTPEQVAARVAARAARAAQAVKPKEVQPALPMGKGASFHPKGGVPASKVVDPLDVLKEANVDVDAGPLSAGERKRIEAVLKTHLEAGMRGFGAVNPVLARNELNYNAWRPKAAYTEARLKSGKVQDFSQWQKAQGYAKVGGGSGSVANSQAPHPTGGSLQHFKQGLDNDTANPEEMQKLAVLDYVIGSMDRHGSNLQRDSSGHLWAIDNGYSMPGTKTADGFMFRSADVKGWIGKGALAPKMPKAMRDQIRQSLEHTDWKALVARHPGMSKLEREAFLGRVVNMQDALKTEDGLIKLWKRQQVMY